MDLKHLIILTSFSGIYFFNSTMVICQTISVGFGPNYTLTKQKKPMVNGMNYFDNTDYSFKFSYEHLIFKKKWSTLISYTKFKGYTFIAFEEGSVIGYDGFPTLAIGYNGVENNRFDLGIKYHSLNFKKFYLNTFVSLGFQLSTPDGSEFYDIEPPNGPDYVQLGTLITKTNDITQFVPAIGIDIGVICCKRIDFKLTLQGVFAFKSFQDMYFNYSYKGVTQETAIFETTGTGIFTSISVGYRFEKIE